MKKTIYPCLWFNNQAGEAAKYYCSIFKNSFILSENPLVVSFSLNDNRFLALNGRIDFEFNESLSFVVECEDQNEIDNYWDALCMDGKEGMCGWLKDKYGVSWQIIPRILPELMSEPERARKVTNAFLSMKKLIIKDLMEA